MELVEDWLRSYLRCCPGLTDLRTGSFIANVLFSDAGMIFGLMASVSGCLHLRAWKVLLDQASPDCSLSHFAAPLQGLWTCACPAPSAHLSSFYFILFCFILLAMPCGMWDLSSPTKDRTQAPCLEAWSLNHWTAREAPQLLLVS